MRITKKRDERKQEIIDLSRTLFLEKGYEAASVREIIGQTESLGSPGLFYYYFKSKQDIYQAVIEEMADEMEKHRFAVFEENENDPVQAILALLTVLQEDSLEVQKFRLSGKDKTLLSQVSQRLMSSGEILTEHIFASLLQKNVILADVLINEKALPQLSHFIVSGISAVLMNCQPEDSREDTLNYIKALLSRLIGLEL